LQTIFIQPEQFLSALIVEISTDTMSHGRNETGNWLDAIRNIRLGVNEEIAGVLAHESLLAGKTSAIWRQAPHVAPDHQQAARLRPAKASALTVSTASFHFAVLHETVRPHC
jgi:hypothetical protein